MRWGNSAYGVYVNLTRSYVSKHRAFKIVGMHSLLLNCYELEKAQTVHCGMFE